MSGLDSKVIHILNELNQLPSTLRQHRILEEVSGRLQDATSVLFSWLRTSSDITLDDEVHIVILCDVVRSSQRIEWAFDTLSLVCRATTKWYYRESPYLSHAALGLTGYRSAGQ